MCDRFAMCERFTFYDRSEVDWEQYVRMRNGKCEMRMHVEMGLKAPFTLYRITLWEATKAAQAEAQMWV